jgi:hypothetical protein
MSNQILVFYGSYRSDRMGIRLAEFLVQRLWRRGDTVDSSGSAICRAPKGS